MSQLEELLSARLPRRVAVINAGVPGYGPDQESLVMEDEIESAKPNLVVFALYSGNDFGDLIRNKLFRLDEHRQLIPERPTLDADLVRGFAGAYKQQPSFQFIRRAEKLVEGFQKGRDSVTEAYTKKSQDLLDAWRLQAQKEYENFVLESDNQVHNLFLDGYDIDISTAPQAGSSRLKAALMEGIIDRIQRIAAKQSIPLIFLIIPSPIDVLDRWDVSVDAARFPEYRRSALTEGVERIVNERNFYYLNLFEPFRTHQPENLYYHGLDDHWNARGQRLAATLTVDYILRHEALRNAVSRAGSSTGTESESQ